MKRAMSGKGRKGAPPLPRQRKALRVVQMTLIVVSVVIGKMAFGMIKETSRSRGLGEVAGLGVVAIVILLTALWMGVRTVRGPEPPHLD